MRSGMNELYTLKELTTLIHSSRSRFSIPPAVDSLATVEVLLPRARRPVGEFDPEVHHSPLALSLRRLDDVFRLDDMRDHLFIPSLARTCEVLGGELSLLPVRRL